jgi:hypothetical protein
MKINIGPYPSPITVSNLENKWIKYTHKKYSWEVDETDYSKLDIFVLNVLDIFQKILNVTVNKFFYNDKKRRIKIRIDDYDTWGMDHTLSMIILPMLKQLKATKHGSPYVELEDVPENLHPDKNRDIMHKNGEIEEWDIDNTVHERWSWVLDEMIHSFECELDEDWDLQFFSGERDYQWKELDNGMSEMVKGENDTFKVDQEAMDKAWSRRKNGLRLFGKYFHGLWD